MEAEEGKKANRGVACVKDLAKEELRKVPARYIRSDIDPIVSNNNNSSPSSPQVPIIDLSNLFSCDDNVKAAEVQKLHMASQDWGFFQVINPKHASLISTISSPRAPS